MNDGKKGRRRRSSSLLYQEPPESIEHKSDQSALPNLNADWVNAKGGSSNSPSSPNDSDLVPEILIGQLRCRQADRKSAWTIHIVLIIALKILFDIIPGVSQETSWTLTNITYMFGSYLMFHWVQGVPFEFNAGAYDNLNMWEQIDNGDQYTPAKKFLLLVPILLFLLSTHYTHYGVIVCGSAFYPAILTIDSFSVFFPAVLGGQNGTVRRGSRDRDKKKQYAAILT
ncbi:hypothetical protein G7Y79_00003g010980 [Physcia stellaris]|nr:hypothetical protein G7Y79_00003g010980 [Physcia stellaris]